MRVDKPSNKGFIPARHGEDIRFGKANFFKDTYHNFYICKEKFFDSKIKGNDTVELLEKKMNNPNLYYVPPADYDFEEFSQFCSTHYKLRLFYPLAEEDLGLEIKKKKVSNETFSNKEMTFLMYSLIFGLAHLQELGFVHGQLEPQWIAKTTTGYAVMENPLFNPFRVVKLRNKKELYLSPEAFRDAKYMKVMGVNFNLSKSDVFSAGMMILEAGIMISLRDIYGDNSNTEILRPSLERKIEIFDERYPENVLLRSTLRRMLEFDPKFRPDFMTLRRKLPNFQDILTYFSRVEDSFPTPENIPVKKSSIFNQNNIQRFDPKTQVTIAKSLRKLPVQIDNSNVREGIRLNLKSSMGMGPSRPVALISGTEGIVQPLINRPSLPLQEENSYNKKLLNVRFSQLKTPIRDYEEKNVYKIWRDPQSNPYDNQFQYNEDAGIEQRPLVKKQPSYDKLMTHKLMVRNAPVGKKKKKEKIKKSEKEIKLYQKHNDVIVCESSSEESSTSIAHSFHNKLSTHNNEMINIPQNLSRRPLNPQRIHSKIQQRSKTLPPPRQNQNPVQKIYLLEDPRPHLIHNPDHNKKFQPENPRLSKSSSFVEKHYPQRSVADPHQVTQEFFDREQIRAILTQKVESDGRVNINTLYSGDSEFRQEGENIRFEESTSNPEFNYCSECDIAFREESENLKNNEYRENLKIYQDPYPGYKPVPIIVQPLYSSAPFYHQFPKKEKLMLPSADLTTAGHFNPKFKEKKPKKKKLN